MEFLERTTVAVDAMTFRKPVYVGDVMCIYTDLIQVGTTSIRIHIEAWVIRRNQTSRFLVTEHTSPWTTSVGRGTCSDRV
jgi:acyl-CoA thioesterase YciA